MTSVRDDPRLLFPSSNSFPTDDFESILSPVSDGSASKRPNVLTNKLNSVLSSSYADSETRDALRLLDARGVKDLEHTRQHLRDDAQQEVIAANGSIVDDFGKVASQLKRVGALITVLNQTCDDMRSRIQLARQETAPMLDEASTLLVRKQETESKQQLLTAFNKHFLISDPDLTTLTSSAEPVNDEFFTILARVKQIHKDCEILLGYENQRLGLELMEQVTRDLDAGYKKLYNWIQREFRGLDLEDPQISGSIRRSLRALSERPTLFQNCLDFFGEARQATLSEAFQVALTDSTAGISKAIEFSTHDPLRYIGDMLAWVHSTTVSEKEALEGLFISDASEISRGLTAGKSSEPWARLRRASSSLTNGAVADSDDEEAGGESAFDGHAALNSLISRNMASVAQVLNQRISLTVRNLTDQITIYKCYNILLFYQDIFVKLLGITNMNTHNPHITQAQAGDQTHNTLLVSLSTLQSQARTHFETIVEEDIEAHSASIGPDPTLQAPGILQSNLALFSTILHLRAPNLTTAEFTKLYSTLLAPVLQLCGTTASSLSSDADVDNEISKENSTSTIYKLNYMHPIISTLSAVGKDALLRDFVSAPLRSAEQEVGKSVDELSAIVTDGFLEASGVQGLLDVIDGLGEQSVEEKRSVLLDKLEDASVALDDFLASALMDVQDDLGKLSDKSVAKEVVGGAVEKFCEEFEKLVSIFQALDVDFEDLAEKKGGEKGNDGKEQDALLREIYPRTVAEVKALLS